MPGSILIVDDEEVVIKSCERILEKEGYSVSGVTDAGKAMALLRENPCDLLITDIMMPEVSGIELIRWTRKEAPGTGIIVITGYPSQETIKDALELGIVDYLPKPFSPKLLIDVTEKAISAVKVKPVGEMPVEEGGVDGSLKEIIDIIETNRKKPGALIPVLQQIQEILGYLPPSVQRIIAREMNLPVSEVHAVVSFYSYFTMKPKGKHNVRVCLGTACYVKRASEIISKLQEYMGISEGEMTEDRRYSLETVRCLGACGLAPVVVVDKDTYGDVDPNKVDVIVDRYD